MRKNWRDIAIIVLVIIAIIRPVLPVTHASTFYSLPSGFVFMVASGGCPAGSTEVSALSGKMLYGTVAANGDVGTTGGSNSITPTGTNTSGGYSEGAISWPAGVPTNANGAFAEGALSWPAGVPTNASGAFSEGAISWPANVPTNASVSAGTPAGTNSGAAFSIVTQDYNTGTTAYGPKSLGGTTLASGTTSITLSTQPTFAGSALAAHTHTISWPANPPTIAGGTFTQPTVSWPAGVPTIASGTFTQPTISYPVNVPTIAAGSFTQPTWTGNAFDPHPAYLKVIFCST